MPHFVALCCHVSKTRLVRIRRQTFEFSLDPDPANCLRLTLDSFTLIRWHNSHLMCSDKRTGMLWKTPTNCCLPTVCETHRFVETPTPTPNPAFGFPGQKRVWPQKEKFHPDKWCNSGLWLGVWFWVSIWAGPFPNWLINLRFNKVFGPREVNDLCRGGIS